VEPQWTVAASVPMIILLHNNFHRNDWLKKYILKFVTASLLLVFIARFVLVSNLLPSSLELSGKEARYRAIEKVAKDRPVVFTGSFQDPSLYTFFTGKPATVISSIFTRQTQFDIWHLESKWSDRPVFLYGVYADRSKSFTIDNYQIDGFPADGLQTANRLNMKFSISDDHFKKGDSTTIHATIQNPCKQDINLSSLIYPMKLQVIFFNKKGLTTTDVRLKNEIALLPQQISTPVYFDCTIPDIKEGDYTVGVGFATIFGCTLNSDLKKINIH
jgi:hypothetical protein